MSQTEAVIKLKGSDALIITDVQNDFLPGGSLAIAHGDEVIAPLNACIERFRLAGGPIYAVRDWHPVGHCSFKERGGPWPEHCVAGSHGAEFAKSLRLPANIHIISKAITPDREAYSGFAESELEQLLRVNGVDSIYIGGLATDYCILHTVFDGLRLGFKVYVIEDAVRAVDIYLGDGEKALRMMQAHEAILVQSSRISA